MTPANRKNEDGDHANERAMPVEIGPSTPVILHLSTLAVVIFAALSTGAWVWRVEGKIDQIQRTLEMSDRWTGTHMQTWVDTQAEQNPGHVYLDPTDIREGRHPKRIKPSVASIVQ